MSFLYVPAVSNVMLIANCEHVNCPANSYLPSHDNSAVVKTTALFGGDPDCRRCVFSEYEQRCSATQQLQTCGLASSDSRLRRDSTIECAPLQIYFWPAAGIMLISFVISMPIINFVLTQLSTKRVFFCV